MRKRAPQNNAPPGDYMTKAEAAEALGVTAKMVDVYDRRLLLEAHYPKGARAGKHFLREDVFALADLRAEHKGDFLRRIPQIALRAAAASRRVEKKLDDLMSFLGLNDAALSLEVTDIAAFHLQVEDAARAPVHAADVMDWAKKLLAVHEEYFELVHLHLGDDEPWKPYLELARELARKARPGSRDSIFIEYARANLRNVAYFYERTFRSPREADAKFPGERYSGRLLQRIVPL